MYICTLSRVFGLAILFNFCPFSLIQAQVEENSTESEQTVRVLTIDRLYDSEEFDAEPRIDVQWLADGKRYVRFEQPIEDSDSEDLVAYDAQTGSREILVEASSFKPSGMSEGLDIHR